VALGEPTRDVLGQFDDLFVCPQRPAVASGQGRMVNVNDVSGRGDLAELRNRGQGCLPSTIFRPTRRSPHDKASAHPPQHDGETKHCYRTHPDAQQQRLRRSQSAQLQSHDVKGVAQPRERTVA